MTASPFGFDDALTHGWMLMDRVRIDAYANAIAQSVRPSDVVVDLGAGTGILSILAAKAGARHVYAVERGSIASLAEDVIRRNGCADRITVLREDARTVILPEPPSLIVTETIGDYGFDEEISQLVRVIRRQCQDQVRVIPESLSVHLALMESTQLEAAFQQLSNGMPVALGALAERLAHRPIKTRVRNDQIVSHDVVFWRGALAEDAPRESSDVTFELTRDARVSGIALWFSAEMGNGLHLGSGPFSSEVHWKMPVFPIVPALEVRRGDELSGRLQLRSSGAGPLPAWSLSSPTESRTGDVLRSSSGNYLDFLSGLGLTAESGPKAETGLLRSLLGATQAWDLDSMADRILASHPTRFADRDDARNFAASVWSRLGGV